MSIPASARAPRILEAVPQREGTMRDFAQRTSAGRRFYDNFPPLRALPQLQVSYGSVVVRSFVIAMWLGSGFGFWFAPAVMKSSPSYKFAMYVPYWTWTWGAIFIAIGLMQLWAIGRRWKLPCPGLFAGAIVAAGWAGAFAVEAFQGRLLGVSSPFLMALLAVVQIRENHWIPGWMARRVQR